MFVLGNGLTTHLKKNIIFHPSSQAPGPGLGPGPGPRPAKKDEKSYIAAPLFAIFGRASGQILVKMRVLANKGNFTLVSFACHLHCQILFEMLEDQPPDEVA